VRAIDERYYGRPRACFGRRPSRWRQQFVLGENALSKAAREAVAAHTADELRATFATPVSRSACEASSGPKCSCSRQEFAKLPRSGETVYGFAAVCIRPISPRSPTAGA